MRRLVFCSLLPALMSLGCEEDATAPQPIDLATTVQAGVFNDQGTGEVVASTGSFHPASTNEDNESGTVPGREGQVAPYVVWDAIEVGAITLRFINGSGTLAVYEVRIDGQPEGDASHPVVSTTFAHPTTGLPADADDVIHPTVCVDDRATPHPDCATSPHSVTFEAEETVEIRLALGGERDWDFDWTTFHVPGTEEARDACKDGGWEDLGFQNQGRCIQYMNTGQDSR